MGVRAELLGLLLVFVHHNEPDVNLMVIMMLRQSVYRTLGSRAVCYNRTPVRCTVHVQTVRGNTIQTVARKSKEMADDGQTTHG